MLDLATRADTVKISNDLHHLVTMAMNGTPEDSIEGFDDGARGDGWGEEYPLDSVFVRREERTVNEIVARINKKRVQLDPDFQRDFVWNVGKQSRLIESCVMRIPLPVFYVAEAKDGMIIVVDGLQRLTTLQRYLSNNFPLEFGDTPDGRQHPLNGKRFNDLSITLQERIEDTPLIFYLLDPKAPERAKLDIFDRVNSGEPLSRQQMRNCLYTGAATKWLRDAVQNNEFLEATNRLFDPKTMRDREAANRFCAFRLIGYAHYKEADMDGYLGRALEHMNKLPPDNLDELTMDFAHSMQVNVRLFGKHSFRKSLAKGDGKRSAINISLFDVCSVILADMPKCATEEQDRNVRDTIRNLISENTAFFNAITAWTSATDSVHSRFRIAHEALGKVL